ncbi:MAG: amidohydrolase family protein [Solirubrobacterales bacterium]|nr:amidohydrolase family protein [Solirubrobacterales bacterium]
MRDVLLAGERLDCRLRDGVVAELAPGLTAADGDQILEAAGGSLLPGLADHHLHLRATAAARRSIDLEGRPLSTLTAADGDGLLRVIGAADALARGQLDEMFGDRPVRVQHRSGAVWTLNSAALALLPAELSEKERRTGQFWRSSGRLRALTPSADHAALAEISAELASYGVTHVTDATPDGDPAALNVEQHVLSLAADGTGPRKIILSDHLDLDYGALVSDILDARERGRAVAVHAVSAASLAVLLAAFAETDVRIGDRVEHAAVCSDAAAERLAELGLPVVTQPSLYARHGEGYRRETEPEERELLWRYGGLLALGVRVAVSSDAPYGDLDPWHTIAAAATALPGGERVEPRVSFASLLTEPTDPAGAPRIVRVGREANLCVLADSVSETLDRVLASDQPRVVATFIRGRLSHPRSGRVAPGAHER